MLADVPGVDRDARAAPVAGVEADFLQQAFHHGVKPPRADILDRRVDFGGEARQLVDRVVREVQLDFLGLQQRLVLLDQAGFRLGQDAAEILPCQGLQLDPDRQTALKLGQQVRRLGDVESARGDEQDMVGLDRAVLGRDRGSLDQR